MSTQKEEEKEEPPAVGWIWFILIAIVVGVFVVVSFVSEKADPLKLKLYEEMKLYDESRRQMRLGGGANKGTNFPKANQGSNFPKTVKKDVFGSNFEGPKANNPGSNFGGRQSKNVF